MNKPNASICVVGSLNMDLVVRSPQLPSPGQTISGGPFATYHGGKGANQAVAAARLGGKVAMIGRVGDDAFGQQMRDGLASEGIDVGQVATVEATASGIALITVQEDGQNTIVIAPGANAALSVADIEAAADQIRQAGVLVLQLETPLETVAAAARIAHEAGVKVLLNPAPAQALPSELLSNVDVLLPNQTEAALLSGMAANNETEAIEAAQHLRSFGIEYVIVTLGDQGALLLGPEGVQRVEPHQVTPVDATAAGDAFVGAFAVALAEGYDYPTALAWGNAAGALAVTAAGAQPSLPTRVALEALLAGR